MRILGAGLLFLLVYQTGFAQQEPSPSSDHSPKDVVKASSRSWAEQIKKYRMPNHDPSDWNTESDPWRLDDVEGEVCYTVRSYLVARVDRQGDETQIVASSTCQPGSKFGMRKATAEQVDPSR